MNFFFFLVTLSFHRIFSQNFLNFSVSILFTAVELLLTSSQLTPKKNGWDWIWSAREISPRSSLLIRSLAAAESTGEKNLCEFEEFQNGRHFSILLFPCKLALLASLSNA